MTAIVEAHQHFWDYGTYRTSWIEKPPYAGDPVFAPIRQSFVPTDLQPELEAARVSASISAGSGRSARERYFAHTRGLDPMDRWGRRVDSSRLIPMKPHGRLSDSAANRSLLVYGI
jgi:hypothetical protein